MPAADDNLLPALARSVQGQPAGLVSRLGAAVIDFLVVVVVVAGCYAGFLGAKFVVSPTSFDISRQPGWLVVPLGVVVSVGYLAESWHSTGRSYGCSLMGLRVLPRQAVSQHPLTATPPDVEHRPQHVRLVPALLRAVLYVFFPLGLFWVAVSADNRSVQDILFGTVVVYDWLPARDVITH